MLFKWWPAEPQWVGSVPLSFSSVMANNHLLVSTSVIVTQTKHFPPSDFWKTRNESRNFGQKHEVELIKEEKRKVIEAEIRVQVSNSFILHS